MKHIAILALMSATPAYAQCPVAADLNYGILMTEADGTENLFRAVGGDFVENVVKFPDGVAFTNALAQGTYILRSADLVDGVVDPSTMTVTVYNIADVDLPRPAPNTSSQFLTKVTDPDGTASRETQDLTWGAERAISIGACTLSGFDGTVTYTGPDYVLTETMQFLPDLNIALLTSYQWDDEELVEFAPVAIAAVR